MEVIDTPQATNEVPHSLSPMTLGGRRAVLRLLQRERHVQRAALSVRIRPSFGEEWDTGLDDLISRGIVKEYGEVLRRNGGRTRSVVMYSFGDDHPADSIDWAAMAPADIDDWIERFPRK
jgi:hypothetical protein